MKQKEYAEKFVPAVDNVLPMAIRLLGSTEQGEDVVQEVLLSLWERRKTLHIKTNHKAFLYKTVRNKCLDRLKQNKRFDLYDENTISQKESGNNEEFDTMQWIHSCIATLPQNQQDVVNMREIDGLEFTEISELLGLTEANVRMLLSRAKKRLQELIPKGL